VELAPDFVKGYSRKGALQFFMKEYDKAMATYEAGLKYEPDNAELKEGIMRCLEAIDRIAHGEWCFVIHVAGSGVCGECTCLCVSVLPPGSCVA
jgi:tetratricopeptide (TPR) repeat protein